MPGALILPQLLEQEIDQRITEGCLLDREGYLARLHTIDPSDRKSLEALYDELMTLEPTVDYPFQEPSDLAGIRAAPPGPFPPVARRNSVEGVVRTHPWRLAGALLWVLIG